MPTFLAIITLLVSICSQSLLADLSQFELGSCSGDSRRASQLIEYVYESIVSTLHSCASKYVPNHHVNFYKLLLDSGVIMLEGKGHLIR